MPISSLNPFEATTFRSAGPFFQDNSWQIDMSSANFVVHDTGLKMVPEYTSSSNFVVQEDSSSVWRKLTNFLMMESSSNPHRSIDIVPLKDDYQICGLTINQGKACCWTITLYECAGEFNYTGKQGILVECSRQSGCAVEFTQFFRTISALWKKPQSLRRLMKAPMLDIKQDHTHVDEPYLTSLLAMADSNYYQNQHDALGTLSFVSSKACNQRYLASQKVVLNIIKSALKTSDNELMRSAASLLMNLSEEPSVCNAIQSSLAPVIKSCMKQIDNIDASEHDDQHTFLYQSLIRENLEDLCELSLAF